MSYNISYIITTRLIYMFYNISYIITTRLIYMFDIISYIITTGGKCPHYLEKIIDKLGHFKWF